LDKDPLQVPNNTAIFYFADKRKSALSINCHLLHTIEEENGLVIFDYVNINE